MAEPSLALLLALERAGLAGPHITRGPIRITIRALVHHAARLTGQSEVDILGPRRTDPLARVRHAVVTVALWQAEAEGYAISLPQIGRALGGRDHSTAINSRERAKDLLPRDPEFAWFVERLWAAGECDPFADAEAAREPEPEPVSTAAKAPAPRRPAPPPVVRVIPGEYVPRHALPPPVLDDEPYEEGDCSFPGYAFASSAMLDALRRERWAA